MSEDKKLTAALAKCIGLQSGPDGRGGMRVVAHFPHGGDESELFSLLNTALASALAANGKFLA